MSFYPAVEVAYAAGIVDGEGSIVIDHRRASNGKRYHSLRCTVTNTNIDVLDFFAKRWPRSNRSDTTTPGRRKCYQQCWSGPQAAEVLRDLAPYLIIKQRQALLALDFQADVDASARAHLTPDVIEIRSGMRQRMSDFNQGVA